MAAQALDAVSLAVMPGEMVALLGPNGAGKSTLFQLLTGLFVADSGTVEVLGADMRRQPVRALAQLGVVFQQPALDLNLSVRASLRARRPARAAVLRVAPADRCAARASAWPRRPRSRAPALRRQPPQGGTAARPAARAQAAADGRSHRGPGSRLARAADRRGAARPRRTRHWACCGPRTWWTRPARPARDRAAPGKVRFKQVRPRCANCTASRLEGASWH